MNVKSLKSDWLFVGNGREESVNIPHDFMIETDRTPDSPTCADYGFFQPCKGTYIRKIEKDPSALKHFIKFDGVMGLCEVYVNDNRVKFHPYGYTAFICDISDFLHEGDNELRVQVDATAQPASRWYTGAGIYREVELLTSGCDYIVPFETCVKVISINGDDAEIAIDVEIFSSERGEAELAFNIPEIGHTVKRSTWLENGENHFSCKTVLHGIKRWSTDTPVVYSCEVALNTKTCSDSETVNFGIREVKCDPKKGFLLNGEPVKLYGTCNHHDNGIVGAASYRSAEERRVRILKENGFNAIRCSHNPPSSMLLDVCDRMGILVIDEIFDCWMAGKRPYDYHLWFNDYAKEDITSMVKRDRNHPSVIMWSTGNEIYERFGRGDGYKIGKMIADTIKEYDTTRPLTHAFCNPWDQGDYADTMRETENYPAEKMDFWGEKMMPQAGNLDVVGYNYLNNRIDKDIQRFPEHLFAITESYPVDAVWSRRLMDKHTQLIGEFVWTGWDYFGETGIGHIYHGTDKAPIWCLMKHPEHISNCGDFDICGNKKAPSYYRDAAWIDGAVRILTMDPVYFGELFALSSWGFYGVERTWTYSGKEGKKTEVHLYTMADECELLQDGISLGKMVPNEKGMAIFEVEYRPGKLEAIAYKNGVAVGKDEICTVGGASCIDIKADITGKSGKADLIFAEITLLDEKGNPAWEAEDEITVTVSGGKVLGTGSGRIDDTHRYTDPVCNAYRGKLLAAVKCDGESVEITASTDKLTQSVTVNL
ncbi:MAG: DUF4982 domain-containing protein [Oscillospiraceae bacterium]|nr:DUF4982 domain-containing protein [Oscillospiraceae bacterium]